MNQFVNKYTKPPEKELYANSLVLYENMAIEGFAQMQKGATKIAIAVEAILANKLYLEVLDERGLPVYPTQEEYLTELIGKIGIARSTLFEYLKPYRVAKMLGVSTEDYIKMGGDDTWRIITAHVEINRRYEVVSAGEVPSDEIPSTLINLASEISENPDKPDLKILRSDKHKLVAETVGGHSITYAIENNTLHIFDNGVKRISASIYFTRLPDFIQADLLRRLGAKK